MQVFFFSQFICSGYNNVKCVAETQRAEHVSAGQEGWQRNASHSEMLTCSTNKKLLFTNVITGSTRPNKSWTGYKY